MRTRKLIGAVVSAAVAIAGLVLAPNAQAVTGYFKIARIYFDTPGPDTPVSNAKLNGEYVTVENLTGSTHNLNKFSVWDASGHHRTFGSFNLAGHKSARLHTGSGTNNAANIY